MNSGYVLVRQTIHAVLDEAVDVNMSPEYFEQLFESKKPLRVSLLVTSQAGVPISVEATLYRTTVEVPGYESQIYNGVAVVEGQVAVVFFGKEDSKISVMVTIR